MENLKDIYSYDEICKKKEKLEQLTKKAEKNGKSILDANGKIKGWEYKENFYFNNKYKFDKIEDVIKIEDTIRIFKRKEFKKGNLVMKWSKSEWSKVWYLAHCYGFYIKEGDHYLGVKHLVK